ncbi:MAG: GTP-binding protein, partial [Chloroflexota bacterium]
VSNHHVMAVASQVLAAGAGFRLLGLSETMLKAAAPVVAVCAVRSGAGKSPTSRAVARWLRDHGHQVAVVRHPMPYGDLNREAVQRFAGFADLDLHRCTIEEREEYEPHLEGGFTVYAGVDYGEILSQVQRDGATVILWDGGNNDLPFFHPDLLLVVVDPLRAGDELSYHPGQTCLRMADAILINKIDAAGEAQIAEVTRNIAAVNPRAPVLRAASPVSVDSPDEVRGKRVLVVEDGPTTTHGGMPTGAGYAAALRFGAVAVVDPRPWAAGSIADAYRQHPHIGPVLPALGYDEGQRRDLAATIAAVPCDLVLSATPIDLRRTIPIEKPLLRVGYEVAIQGRPGLDDILAPFRHR